MNRNSKNVVRLTESELRNVIKESVKCILKENEDADFGYSIGSEEDIQITLSEIENSIESYFRCKKSMDSNASAYLVDAQNKCDSLCRVLNKLH